VKYIIFDQPGAPLPLVVMFNGPTTHREVAEIFKPTDWTPTSAGFAKSTDQDFIVTGRSESLNLGHGNNDGRLISILSRSTLNTS
jgi:hypothetical protein